MEDKEHDPFDSLGHCICQAHLKMRTSLTRRFAEAGYDITAEQWKVLVYIFRAEGTIQQEIGRVFGKDQAATARILNRLEKQGHIQRVCSLDDRRRREIFVTDTGKTLEKELSRLARENLDQASAGLAAEDVGHLKRILAAIINNFER